MTSAYMLDTDICSYIMQNWPTNVLTALQKQVMQQRRIVISAITYAELRFGAVGKKAPPHANVAVDRFMGHIDEVLPWDQAAADAAATIKKTLSDQGIPIGHNDTLIAGHAIARQCVLVTNNTREFGRVENLQLENWVSAG